MITIRELKKSDINYIEELISYESKHYYQFLSIGWSTSQILSQLKKKTNYSFGLFYKNYLVSFIIGDLFNIEKISEYEILLLYVCKFFRKKGLGTKLINQIEINNSCLKKIYLEVSKNNSDAILFYKKMKFKTVYIRKSYFSFENKKIDALAMTKIY